MESRSVPVRRVDVPSRPAVGPPAKIAAILVALALRGTWIELPTCQAQVRIEAEAFSGAPFGVGRVTIRSGGQVRVNIPQPGGGRLRDAAKNVAKRAVEQLGNTQQDNLNLDGGEIELVEKSGRLFYPVFEKHERPILREFVSVPTEASILFLFKGDAPLELTTYASLPSGGRVTPARDAAGHARLLRAWWGYYAAAADGRNALQEYPPLVEEYLVDTLSRRLRLALPERRSNGDTGLFQRELNLLMGTEAAQIVAAREILLATTAPAAASEAVPEELPRPRPELLNPPAKPQIEPLAMHVPVECLYVRFGSFSNFQWFRHRTEEFGGEVRDVISQRGLDYRLMDRMQRQLGLKESALSELLGDRAIADVALIGTDTFMNEGAAMGTLFQAKNSTFLAANLLQQRAAGLRDMNGGKQENVEIGGRKVSLFSTPDNRMRSFYVADGDFHLVTNSRALVEWFLATGAGDHPSLGASEAFALARASMPLERNDSVFVYLAPEFFQNLMSAHYQIELNRRLHSAVEIELFRIARLAARGESKPAGTIADLVAGDFLPPAFGQHSDNSRLELVGDDLIDSLRGRRGTFTPIPDVPIDRVTPAERSEYLQLADTYTNQWGAMDPMFVGIRREAASAGLERVVIDIKAAPLSAQHTQMLSQWLGPQSDMRLAPVAGDVLAFEAVLRGGTFFSGGDHHLFGALRDADPAIALDPRRGLLARIVMAELEGLNGYLGAWPDPGYLRMLTPLEGNPDAAGYSRSLTGIWRRQFDRFTLLSFQPQVLQQTSQQLKFVKADRPAQVWLHADDLAASKLAPLINAYGYRQSRQVAEGNTRFMNMLSEQLHVPPAEALATSEQLLEAKLISPVGGKYELREISGGNKGWVETTLAQRANNDRPPADYQFPALNWLRGVDLELRADEGQLAIHAEFIMPVEIKPAGARPMPSLFGGAASPAGTQAKSPPSTSKAPATSKAAPAAPNARGASKTR